MTANPDLPILDQLGTEFRQMLDTELGGAAPPARARLPERRPRASGGHDARRVARRAAVVLVLLCLIGGVALAARFGGGDSPPAHTAPAVLGQSAALGWRLSAYRDRGRLCFALDLDGELSSRCAGAPGPDGVRAASAATNRRFVFGLAGPQVEAVRVDVGDFRGHGETHAAGDEAAALGAGVPRGTRWFVVPLAPSQRELRAPALVVPLDARGEPLGRPVADCSLGVVGEICARAIRRRAVNAAG